MIRTQDKQKSEKTRLFLQYSNLKRSFQAFLGTKKESHDQSYRAGEAKGQSEERTNRMMESMKEKAGEAKEKTHETLQQAKEKSTETTEAAKQRTQETAQAARQKTEVGKEKTGGILQQTGEQVKHMVEAVKQKFGFNSTGEEEGDEGRTTDRRDN